MTVGMCRLVKASLLGGWLLGGWLLGGWLRVGRILDGFVQEIGRLVVNHEIELLSLLFNAAAEGHNGWNANRVDKDINPHGLDGELCIERNLRLNHEVALFHRWIVRILDVHVVAIGNKANWDLPIRARVIRLAFCKQSNPPDTAVHVTLNDKGASINHHATLLAIQMLAARAHQHDDFVIATKGDDPVGHSSLPFA